MTFHCLTVFPEMIKDALSHSILKRASDNSIIKINCVNIRDFSADKHRQTDDYPYGGGAGMVMTPEPIYNAYKSIDAPKATRVVYTSPTGKPFTQKLAATFSKESDIIILCGHYEGVDERVIEEIVTDEISLGDFILTGGEICAVAIIDATARLVSGVLGNAQSPLTESFSDVFTAEYPQYTRPAEFLGRRVPDVLLSGNHKNIENWRNEQSAIRTEKYNSYRTGI
ncbi:tRNA (guanosine(37)-N1)-methyltransferase TrmD [Clostridia bacterium]|nr:tRNA (guanosine(37)-N1)-methyltransferase TrmD [Clostridia bacterium]